MGTVPLLVLHQLEVDHPHAHMVTSTNIVYCSALNAALIGGLLHSSVYALHTGGST